MTYLVLGLVKFLGIHLVGAVGLRDRMVGILGENPWKGLYSLISFLGLGLIVFGYGQARAAPVVVWVPPVGMQHAALTLMLPVFPLLAATYLPGRLSRWSGGHPMLVGTVLWGLAHVLANGMLHDVLLFSGFLGWALVVRLSFLRRPPRDIPRAPEAGYNDVIAVVGGLVLYGITLGGTHQWLFGVSPLPR